MIYKKLLTLGLCVAVSFSVACESDENNSIAQAESCINENSNSQSGIASCASFLKGINTPRAKTLRCSITLTAAGVSNKRIINAVEVMEDDAVSNKELQFMALIAVNDTGVADSLPSVCSGTDSPGMEFIANAARMGTMFADIGGIDITTIDEDTTFSGAQITDIITNCENDPLGPGSCLETIGQSATAMHDIFCADSDDSDVCADVSSAIAGGGTAEAIGQALVDLLE